MGDISFPEAVIGAFVLLNILFAVPAAILIGSLWYAGVPVFSHAAVGGYGVVEALLLFSVICRAIQVEFDRRW